MAKKKRKGYDWKPSTHRWVKSSKNKWLTNSSFWNPKKNKLRKSSGGDSMNSSPLTSLYEFLNKQSPEVASRMAARGLIWSPQKHRWILKPEITSEHELPQTRYAQQGFGSIGAPVKPEKPALTGKGSKIAELVDAQGLSDWEKEFLSSIKDQFEKKGSLSDKQWAIVDKIASKHEKQAALDSGEIEAQPLPPVLKKLDKLKKFMPEKHVQAIESMSNQVKAGSTLSEKQEDYLQIIEDNAKKQKKGMTEQASGNIIIRPSTGRGGSLSNIENLVEISGKGAFHPQARKWLEENGFEWGGPMTGKMVLPLTPENRASIKQEAEEELSRQVKENPELASFGGGLDTKRREIVTETLNKKIESVMKLIPQLRDKGFTLKRPDPSAKGYKDTPKLWKMLLGRK
jgi:hypothetical protein|tara:strand:+ start:1082 stop:2281 length:1200 start_codon:yes stop_codon:yes gene_type:complete